MAKRSVKKARQRESQPAAAPAESGSRRPFWMGVLVAALFHALNLALAAFSPMIQALRLHYVEFFSKFYEGGGEPFRPFGARAEPEM